MIRMRKLIITVIVIMAVASALLLVALLSWTIYQHYHEQTGRPGPGLGRVTAALTATLTATPSHNAPMPQATTTKDRQVLPDDQAHGQC
jgi:hypothetical protein